MQPAREPQICTMRLSLHPTNVLYLCVQGRLQEANRFWIALSHGSFTPATATSDCTALLMRAHLSHGDSEGAVKVFQSLPHLPSRPVLSTSVVSAATEALCLGNHPVHTHLVVPVWRVLSSARTVWCSVVDAACQANRFGESMQRAYNS